MNEQQISSHCGDLNWDCWCIVNENVSFLFILQQMETGGLLYFISMTFQKTVTLRKQFLWYSTAFHYAKALLLQCPEMKTCLDDRSTFTKTVNMHHKDFKELTQQLLSSGQGVLCSVSCKNGALHPKMAIQSVVATCSQCTDGTAVHWRKTLTSVFLVEML